MIDQHNQQEIKQYYKHHAMLYDFTRWMFLFGRDTLLRHKEFGVKQQNEAMIVEVGCGTGRNLKQMCQLFPKAKFIGVDLSPHMLHRAMLATRKCGNRTLLVSQPYTLERQFKIYSPADVVLCSYALSMFNPGWKEALDRAKQEMAAQGRIAVVDFHRSSFAWFTKWMGMNHVKMDGHLFEALHEQFNPVFARKYSAFGGLWEYFIFIGERKK
jgi:S-adenosylmethionine-diacylgycerolhomoserine-N-methlytransferase